MALFANRDDLLANGGVVFKIWEFLMRSFHEDAIMHLMMSVCIIECLEYFLDSQ